RQRARVIAAYRDRYAITGDAPLGPPPGTAAQKADRTRALAALGRVHALSPSRDPRPGPTRRASQEPTGLGL
ncbi:hypothetical protein, partial [Sinomonas sp. G460-2]|uniref:hypothetical protein n=1 Tax=Sinomonas sp. G460-2 TaxID=3393464 RepID=UPI0039EE80FF